ncbi:MAG: zinc ribbon domain-containing protein [Candidatus Binataceae bacterium]
MFCTKCGRELPAAAKRCPNCAATVRRRRERSSAARWSVGIVLSIATGALIWLVLVERGQRQRRTDLMLTESSPPATTHTSEAASLGDLFELPKANRGFIGTWGGYLKIAGNSPHNLSAPNCRCHISSAKRTVWCRCGPRSTAMPIGRSSRRASSC